MRYAATASVVMTSVAIAGTVNIVLVETVNRALKKPATTKN